MPLAAVAPPPALTPPTGGDSVVFVSPGRVVEGSVVVVVDGSMVVVVVDGSVVVVVVDGSVVVVVVVDDEVVVLVVDVEVGSMQRIT